MKSTNQTRTWTHAAVYVCSALVVDPVKSCLDGQPGQHAVLAAIPVAGGDVHRTSFVVQGVRGMVTFLVPALRHPQPYSWPLVHHRDRQSVQLLFATLQWTRNISEHMSLNYPALITFKYSHSCLMWSITVNFGLFHNVTVYKDIWSDIHFWNFFVTCQHISCITLFFET